MLVLCAFLSFETINAFAALGTFFVTIFSAIYAYLQYKRYKEEQVVKLLGEYNQRYSTDNNIKTVVSWMLKIAIVDEKGEIKGADPDRSFFKPGIYEKEMFMRFFEELYLHIKNGSVEKRRACLLFSYYPIMFDKFKEFRLDILDYKSKKEQEKEGQNNQNSKYWIFYQMFVEDMNKEWEKYTKELPNK